MHTRVIDLDEVLRLTLAGAELDEVGEGDTGGSDAQHQCVGSLMSRREKRGRDARWE